MHFIRWNVVPIFFFFFVSIFANRKIRLIKMFRLAHSDYFLLLPSDRASVCCSRRNSPFKNRRHAERQVKTCVMRRHNQRVGRRQGGWDEEREKSDSGFPSCRYRWTLSKALDKSFAEAEWHWPEGVVEFIRSFHIRTCVFSYYTISTAFVIIFGIEKYPRRLLL